MNSSTRNTRLCLFGFILLTFLLLKANAGKRIVGGEDVHQDDYGFFVAVKNNQRNWCAGSLIHSDMVLTAAHCDAPVSGLTAIVSAYTRNYIDQGHIPVNVIQRIPHPHFDRSLMKYDMALLKLEFPVYSVDPVQVNRNSSYPPAHASLKVAGLGDTSAGPGFHAPEVLQHVTVEVVDTDDCRRTYGLSVGESLKNEWNLCAMKSGKDSCQGDSGGPLLDQNGVLVGTTSWGVNCASETYPGVYARPDVHWIDEVICNLSDDKPSSCFESDESRSFTSPNSTTQPVSSSWPTLAPTNLSMTQPINTPTQWPTASPTKISTIPPTFNPSISPSNYPTTEPTVLPTVLHSSFSPSNYPSNYPTTKPTAFPTVPPTSSSPTNQPSNYPTTKPTAFPTVPPTSSSPTNQPSDFPTTEPTAFPTRYPTQPKRQFSADSPTSPSLPTLVSLDNLSTTTRPSQPSQWPTAYPTRLPRLGHALPSSSNTPSRQPSAGPSVSNLPSSAPSMKQQSQPPSVSGRPSNFPSITPSVDSTTPHTPTPLSPLVNQGFDSKTRLTQPSLCNDDIYTKFHVNNNHGMKGCFWLQARPELHEELCNDTHQAYHVCEETCGKCKDSCEDSKNWIYFYVDEILRNCEWLYLRPHLQTEECQPGRKAQTLCPETCSACEK